MAYVQGVIRTLRERTQGAQYRENDMWMIYVFLALFLLGLVVEYYKKPVEQCRDGEHDLVDPSLHLNLKPVRCVRCGYIPEDTPQQGGGDE